jgi:hypothetical protein
MVSMHTIGHLAAHAAQSLFEEGLDTAGWWLYHEIECARETKFSSVSYGGLCCSARVLSTELTSLARGNLI